MQVKIVLRDRETGRYFRNPLEWVANPYDALTFPNILEAEEFCRRRGLTQVQYIQQSGNFSRPLRLLRRKPEVAESKKSVTSTAEIPPCYS